MKSAEDVVNIDLEYICSNLKEEFISMSGQRILITGGAGFLGYYLVQSILHWNNTIDGTQNIKITVYDNYVRGVPAWLMKLGGDKNLTLIEHDITNPLPPDIDEFQYIIHAASIASPTYYRKYPIETMDANVNGLRFLLDYFRNLKENINPVNGFLFFSTSEIYGDPSTESIPTPEIYNGNVSCTGPRACYDESKRFGETLCVSFSKEHNLPIKIARPFNNFGPGLKITDKRVIPDFVRDILERRDIIMLSDGSPTRTFCYIADAIVGYYKILVRGKSGNSYNIGVEEPEISMSDLAKRIVGLAGELFDYKGKVVLQASTDRNYLIDNPNRRCPNITKARNDLDYNPGIDLDEGLRRSLIWYGENREAVEA